MDAHPILNGSLKDMDVYGCEVFELDAIARNTGLADRAAIGARHGAGAVANVRVGHNLAVRVRAVGEPQPASGKFRKDVCVQPSEVGLLGPGLTGEVLVPRIVRPSWRQFVLRLRQVGSDSCRRAALLRVNT